MSLLSSNNILRSLRVACRLHPDSKLISDMESGDVVCSECGLVVGDRLIDASSEWRSFGEGPDQSRVGRPEDPFFENGTLTTLIGTPAGERSGMSTYVKCTAEPAKDRSLRLAFRDMSDAADRIHLPGSKNGFKSPYMQREKFNDNFVFFSLKHQIWPDHHPLRRSNKAHIMPDLFHPALIVLFGVAENVCQSLDLVRFVHGDRSYVTAQEIVEKLFKTSFHYGYAYGVLEQGHRQFKLFLSLMSSWSDDPIFKQEMWKFCWELVGAVLETARGVYKEVHDRITAVGNHKGALGIACLFIACRIEKITRTFHEICQSAQYSKRQVAKCYREISKLLDLREGTADGNEYELVERFCAQLVLPRTVMKVAAHVAKEAMDQDLFPSRGPDVVCAAAILAVALASGHEKQLSDMVTVSGAKKHGIHQAFRTITANAEKLCPGDFKPNIALSEWAKMVVS